MRAVICGQIAYKLKGETWKNLKDVIYRNTGAKISASTDNV